MAASMLSAVLTSTLSFTSKNPSSETGKRKNGFRSSCNAYCNLTIARYQDRLSAFRMPPRHSFYTDLGHDRTLARRWRIHIFLPHLIASMEELEETYVMIKPDGVQRGLVGEIISRFEKKGFLLKGLKLFHCSRELAEDHYEELKDKSFYPKLVDYITSGPVVCMAWEGIGVVASARKIIGATNPLEADPGTIRGDFAVQTGRNVIHGSDSPVNGSREVALWFNKDELHEWVPAQLPCLKK